MKRLFYRQKVLLACVECFSEGIAVEQLDRYMFKIVRSMDNKIYDFVPYKGSCTSFLLDSDVQSLHTHGILQFVPCWPGSGEYTLKVTDKYALVHFLSKLKSGDADVVARLCGNGIYTVDWEWYNYLYFEDLFYARDGEIIKKYFDERNANKLGEMILLNERMSKQSEGNLFTVGYEGLSIDAFLNLLLREKIDVVCDVRWNGWSHKYGFSVRLLEWLLRKVGIEYRDCSSLGIESKRRKGLKMQRDYDRLLDEYEGQVLTRHEEELKDIIGLLVKKGKRVSLMCFEGDPKRCHRTRIANVLRGMLGLVYEVVDLK